jgi:hypothetical protein
MTVPWLKPNSAASFDWLMSWKKRSLTIRRSRSLGSEASRPPQDHPGIAARVAGVVDRNLD